jgi:hypothetical protein
MLKRNVHHGSKTTCEFIGIGWHFAFCNLGLVKQQMRGVLQQPII